MKKIIIFITMISLIGLSCKKSTLQQINPNQPGLASLSTEGGITSFALGIYEKWLANVPGEGNINIMVVAWTQHTILGDEAFCPYGNFAFRWTDQTYSVTLPGGTVVVNPNGRAQKPELQALNSRGAGERNAFQYEWSVNYFIIGQANQLLSALDNPGLTFSGDAATKKNTLKAWALWWKGYAYSRLGSFYLSGVINNNAPDGTTSSTFVDHNGLITEANRNLDACAAILAALANNTDYTTLITKITPSMFVSATPSLDIKNGIMTPAMWMRNIYTLEARNFLVNKKVATFTAADWTTLSALTAQGITKTDNTFCYALDPNLVNDLNGQFFGLGSPQGYIGDGNQFTFASERLIQDFKPGDTRFTNGFYQLTPGDYNVNIRGRGIQFGSRWMPKSIEGGTDDNGNPYPFGLYGTNANLGVTPIAGSWDENALMTAEAKIRSGSDIQGGLAIIDNVRATQGAGLAAVANTGLNQAQAIEELRKERRIGLFLRGLAFYDARRWGVTAPVSAGGGRAGAMVLVPGSLLTPVSASPSLLPCVMDYQYLDYYDVPQNELDFNTPASGSAAVKN